MVTAETGFLSLGQPTARRMAVRSGLTGSLLVHGPAGAGKGAFVDDLLALAFCTGADPERRPCNACRGCRDARARTHPDLVIGSPQAWRDARAVGESIVAVARRWLLEAAGAPIVASRRIVLIEGADAANEQVQNAMLKALEEPTDRHTFILVADEPSHLLPTIRSRCQPLRIGPVARDELVGHLMERVGLPADQAEALARLANGLAGTAVGLADRADLIEWRRRVQAQLLELADRGRAERFGVVGDLLDEAARLHALAPAPSAEH
jgi:DNA polymerase-3 subunit delta'